jgi:hypothetical protein
VQPGASVAKRVLDSRVRPGDEPIERHRHGENNCGQWRFLSGPPGLGAATMVSRLRDTVTRLGGWHHSR